MATICFSTRRLRMHFRGALSPGTGLLPSLDILDISWIKKWTAGYFEAKFQAEYPTFQFFIKKAVLALQW